MWQILTVILLTACGMWGGQQNKWVRRYLIPAIATAHSASKIKKKKWKATFLLPLIGILSMGYGENSKLRRLLGGSDFWTRVVYGFLVSIPFLFLGKWWACLILPIAKSIKAGGFQITNTKDFLWEDFIFYGTIGILVVC